VTPIEAYVLNGSFGIFGLEKAIEKIDAGERQLRSELESRLRNEDVSWAYEEVVGYAAPQLIRCAALSDLLITGRAAHAALVQRPQLRTLGEIITAATTPVLIPGDENKLFDPFGTAVVAWNGSIEAANAARCSLDLLKLASEVHVVRYTEEKERDFPDVRLTGYLARHDIHAQLDVRTVRRDFAEDLVEYASLHDASYLVMGGYGHSRAGEFLFGGVTRELLRASATPLLIAH
jgi:nucleotide-binding universal stress UspA family protein